MKKVLILIICISAGLLACSRQPKTSCLNGNKMPANILDAAVQIGDTLIFALENQKFDQIYDAGSESLKKAQTREQFNLVLQGIANNFFRPEFSRLTEAYYLTNKAGKKFEVVNVPCNLEIENVNDIYQAPPNRELVSLIYSSMANEESAHIFVELIKEGGTWKLFSLVPGLETLKKKNVDDFVNLARQSREQNKPKLALLYYKIAFLLADYSPNVIEFVSLKVAQEMIQVKTDYMPAGTPQIWATTDASNFEVYNVDAFIEKGEPWVNIDWIVDSFDDTKKLEELSEQLLDFAFEKFPEAKEFFVGIIVTGRSKDPRLVTQAYRKIRRFSEAAE